MSDHTTGADAPFEGWAVLELMGHRRLVGYVRETTLAGAGVLRIDVLNTVGGGSAEPATQFYPPSALYCLTPCTEEAARRCVERPAGFHMAVLPFGLSTSDDEDDDEVIEPEDDGECEPDLDHRMGLDAARGGAR